MKGAIMLEAALLYRFPIACTGPELKDLRW